MLSKFSVKTPVVTLALLMISLFSVNSYSAQAVFPSFTVDRFQLWQFYPGGPVNGYLAADHISNGYYGRSGTAPWPGDHFKIKVEITSTAVTSVEFFIDYDSDGYMDTNERIYLSEKDPTAGVTPPLNWSYENIKTIGSTSGVKKPYVFYTTLFVEMTDINSYLNSGWPEVATPLSSTKIFVRIKNSDGEFLLNDIGISGY
ncbi:hypothetical protein [Thalassolituus hydrocarboniclasticus]|uniref:Uncharacterized protein n=1 Tax=Thalassolituus hydrocarboniclasticus TaxID=2742796 RepID=A0ABY6AE24_9GAMM|nr:hypothetical protein [Thalassolituus hydrocarboniclasticus]UXD88709.1 hypothetical protein HUF19_15270 [Thalassolituus hydrocarboniclasticus]